MCAHAAQAFQPFLSSALSQGQGPLPLLQYVFNMRFEVLLRNLQSRRSLARFFQNSCGYIVEIVRDKGVRQSRAELFGRRAQKCCVL